MVYPAIEGVKPLQAPEVVSVIKQMESRGQRFGPDGSLLTSRTGAQGEMQVQPGTAADPGFGVRPASDLNQPDELARVGREYAGAMTARYGHTALVLASYNAGPGAVDKWLAKYGDPRTGKVSVSDWIAQIPFSETKKYVTEGMRKLSGAEATQPVMGPSVNQVKAETLPALLDRARTHAEAMYPNDPRFVDGYVARTLQNANQVLGAEQARQAAAHDTLTQALVGTKGDGSDAVKTIDQAMANPSIRAAFETATPEGRLAFQTRLARGDQKWDQQSFDLYYKQLGMASERPAEFTDATTNDLSQLFGRMPDHALKELSMLQRSINSKDAAQQAKDLNWQHAKSNVDDMLTPLGLGSSAKKGSKTQQDANEQFYGRLNESMTRFYEANKRWPNTQETRQVAAGLLTQGAQRGTWFGVYDSSKRQYEVAPEDQSKFYVPLPSARSPEFADLSAKFKRVYGRAASQGELQNFWTAYKLSGGK
jgi:soluble lytic murein transglycosylase